jgi:acyl-[acyl carrier protein]--UDP-N-acetylglucosamine O-acyltransferase
MRNPTLAVVGAWVNPDPEGVRMEPTNGRIALDRDLHISDVDEAFAIVHEDAVVSKDAIVGATAEWRGRATRFPACIGPGVIVRDFATVQAGCDRHTLIGEGTLLMSGSYVAHDVRIGSDCVIKPGAHVAGCVTIGDRVDVGMGAMIRQHVKIGDRARIGMGAVVIRDVPAGETWVGNPARKISTAPPEDGAK